jgi:hypothetical protein
MLVHKATPVELAECREFLGMPEDVYSFESVKKRAEKLRRELTASTFSFLPFFLLQDP